MLSKLAYVAPLFLGCLEAAPIEIDINYQAKSMSRSVQGNDFRKDIIMLAGANLEALPVTLQNYMNAQYIGKIFLGGTTQNTSLSEVDVIFDTGSWWVWVQEKDCQNASGNMCTS